MCDCNGLTFSNCQNCGVTNSNTSCGTCLACGIINSLGTIRNMKISSDGGWSALYVVGNGQKKIVLPISGRKYNMGYDDTINSSKNLTKSKTLFGAKENAISYAHLHIPNTKSKQILSLKFEKIKDKVEAEITATYTNPPDKKKHLPENIVTLIGTLKGDIMKFHKLKA